MHELSIAMSLLEMAADEATRAGCGRITTVTIHYGQISGIMPEALQLAFESLTAGSVHAGATLELVLLPLRLRCPFCQAVFPGETPEDRFRPCPQCGEEFGHIVVQGTELLLARVEAEPLPSA